MGVIGGDWHNETCKAAWEAIETAYDKVRELKGEDEGINAVLVSTLDRLSKIES
jgi:hypothetical protein